MSQSQKKVRKLTYTACYNGTIDCQQVIMTRARCMLENVKYYWRTDKTYEARLFLR